MDTIEKNALTKGGEFIIKETNPADVFIPAELSEEQQMMRKAMHDFIEQEVEPRIDLIDSQKDLSIAPMLLEKAGELGFLAIGVPEEYGGIEMDFLTAISNNEVGGQAHSISLVVGVQTSIGIAPILLYGNAEQKAKYLPKLVSAEWKTCYCLTEPGSGSDANSAKTKATLSEDGSHYIINGQKMWITNAGFSNIFIVFAKIDNDPNLSAFIIEESFGGITKGEEEKKMGIKGSSTRQIFFENVKVPAENLLGERNGGFKIAVNVLNTGRIKLGVSAVGVSKKCIGYSVKYANERIQFGVPISSFGAIKHKLGQMAALTYAQESAIYRTAYNIDRAHDDMIANGMDPIKAKSKCVEEYAIECAMLKVFGSEMQGYVVDEGVQIYGGMGFSAESPVERLYRDARITRIFEGTNEINRMLTVDMLLRKAMKGQLDLLSAAKKVSNELMAVPTFGDAPEGSLGTEKELVTKLKKSVLLIAGAAVQRIGMALKEEQEILLNVADMLMHTYILESTVLRTQKRINLYGEAANEAQIAMTKIVAIEAAEKTAYAGRQAIYAFADGDEQRMLLLGLKRFTKVQPYNTKNARRKIADKLIEANAYCF